MKSLNIYREGSTSSRFAILRLILLVPLICTALDAHGLDPQRGYSQYMRTRWTTRNGFPGGRINAIVQTKDGFLWIATGRGLWRFDSFEFVPVGRDNHTSAPVSQALMLVTSVDGALWVWDQDMNLQRYFRGKFEDLSSKNSDQRQSVSAIAASSDGGVLVATRAPRLFVYRNESSAQLTRPSNLWIPSPQTIAATTDGKSWMATYQAGLFYWDGRLATPVTKGLPDSKINCMLPVEHGGLWIGTDNGLVFWNGQQISSKIPSSALQGSRVLSLAKDHEGNLWIGTSGGLFRLNSAGLVEMDEGQPGGGRGRTVTAIFEDRENNLWVGDANGLERLSDGPLRTYSAADNLPADISGPIYADGAGRVWIAPSSGGLFRIAGGKTQAVAPEQLGRDVIYSISGAGNDLWLGRRDGGLTQLTCPSGSNGDACSLKTERNVQGSTQNSLSSVFRSSDGSIWAGTLTGGVLRLKDHRIFHLTSADGLGSNTISSIDEGRDGTLWFATSDGLSRLANGSMKTYRARDGLPSDEVITVLARSSENVWVGTSEGLAYFSSGGITAVADPHPAFHEQIFGIAEDKEGFLWMATSNHLFRVRESALRKGAVEEGDYQEYGEQDGLRGSEGVRRDRSVVADLDGRIWISTSHGVSMADPAKLREASAPLVPLVAGITADGIKASLDEAIFIAPDPQRVSLSYEAVSLTFPYRVRYRFKLQGFDRDWSDSTEIRQVVYTNLKPGTYHFGLLASRGDGRWNGSEAVITFTIKPSLWETWWFRVSLGLCCALLLCVLYLYRLQLATRRIHERLGARLEERERIARELHDTLLQGFQGLALRIQGVLKTLPPHETAHRALEMILDRTDLVLMEARERVKDLRQAQITGDELSRAIVSCGEELRQGSAIDFNVVVSGVPQALDLEVFNEVLAIATEALRNSFVHSKAQKIQAEIAYGRGTFRLRVTDDGIGIEKSMLAEGRAGHWGLAGMRERAQRIGAKIKVVTNTGQGTEIMVSIPAKLAFSRTGKLTLQDRMKRYLSRRR